VQLSSAPGTTEKSSVELDSRALRRSVVKRYGFALLTVGVSTATTYALRGWLNQIYTPLFFGAVMASTWYGGSGAGLLATSVSAIALELIITTSEAMPSAVTNEMVRLILFTTIAIATSATIAIWRKDRVSMQRVHDELERRVRTRTEELVRLNQQLRAEIVERERAEATVRASEEQFRELFEHAPV
jgi:hypothetical protein